MLCIFFFFFLFGFLHDNFSITGHSYSVNPGNKMYNASKQALRVLTEGLRHELAAAGDGHIKASVSCLARIIEILYFIDDNNVLYRPR